MASKALSTLMMGRTGPKISSCITGSVGLTSTKIVGSINLSFASAFPPTATVPLLIRLRRRLRTRLFMDQLLPKTIHDLLKICRVDNATEVRTCLHIISVPFLKNNLCFFNKFILDFFGT